MFKTNDVFEVINIRDSNRGASVETRLILIDSLTRDQFIRLSLCIILVRDAWLLEKKKDGVISIT